ncbi:TolB family protein [Tahibacter amnicola]|uniref:WD40 repeat protein n=1 Tax=Tahibacter amnicola TaxID=2976241 RepID=A0ABY6BKG9_9GAMM|nr:hypothetical protein [Tahibacter amnicola]UXI69967.1 hypothetical protein N4264_10170 [Tahibacter amnicola]
MDRVRQGGAGFVLIVAALPGLAGASPAAGAARLVAPGVVSTAANDYNFAISRTDDVAVFATSAARFEGARIHIGRFRGDRFDELPALHFQRDGYRYSDPWLTPDGTMLLFISDQPHPGRAADAKDLDIWQVHLRDGRWGEPQRLGGEINSRSDELGPEVHAGVLYFNSSRPGGPSKTAIYRAAIGDGLAAQVEALPAAINRGDHQGDFTLSADGMTAAFWSMRTGETEKLDLYLARRVGDGWGEAEKLPAPFSSPGNDFTPFFAADGKTLYFASTRTLDEDTAGAALSNGLSNVFWATLPAAWHTRPGSKR